MGWDFKKLPVEEIPNVKVLLSERNIQALIDLHEKYELSDYDYCCDKTPGVREGVLKWFVYGLKQFI